ncbi:MAG: alkaline phosphatase D family protein [Actinomycetes bacterium]
MSVTWCWAGAAGPTSFTVATKVSSTANVRLKVADNAAMTGATFFGPVTPSAQFVAKVTASGLTPRTRYYWQVEHGGTVDTGKSGKARTHGPVGEPFSFGFALGGDAGGNGRVTPGLGVVNCAGALSNHTVFSDIADIHDPLFFVHPGDINYYNLGGATYECGTSPSSSVANYRMTYDDTLTQPEQMYLYRNAPTVHVWDDHDFGPNNSDKTHAGKANIAQVYREVEPHYPLALGSGPVYHSFQVGRVLFMVSDLRYERDPATDPDTAAKSQIGTVQKAWIETLLSTSDAAALVWVTSTPWLNTSGGSWGSYSSEREELAQLFRDLGWASRMCAVSADMHALAISSGGLSNPWGGFPVFQFAPLDTNPSTGVDHPYYDVGFLGTQGSYGTMQVLDDGNRVAINGACWTQAGGLQFDHTFFPGASLSTTVPVLDYADDGDGGDIAPPFEPTEDDQAIRNDVTAERPDGAAVRVVAETGPLSVLPPPDGAGRYEESVSVNVDDDDLLQDQAGWRVHLGTWDEPRYPAVSPRLTAKPDKLAPLVLPLETGDRFRIENLPEWAVTTGDADLLVEGYDEELSPTEWTITFNTSPAGRYTVAVLDDRVLGRVDTDGSSLGADIDVDDTSLSVAVDAGPLWTTDPDEAGFDITVGVEDMTVTAVTGTASPQMLTVVRNVNGLARAHTTGEAVNLAHPAILAL